MSIPGQDAVNRFLENEVRLDDFLNSSASYTDKNGNIIESLPHLAARVDSMTLNITDRGDWATATEYVKNDISTNNSIVYICLINHTAGTFATDLAAGKWSVYKNVTNAELADATNALKGAGKVGFLASLAYAAGTVGRFLKDLGTSAGASMIGFIRSGTGSVARTVQDKLIERISLQDFGAIGNGNADESLAFQKALDYATSIGGNCCIDFGPGLKYYIPTTVFSNSSNLKNITFDGHGSKLIGGANSILILGDYTSANHPSQITIKDISITNNNMSGNGIAIYNGQMCNIDIAAHDLGGVALRFGGDAATGQGIGEWSHLRLRAYNVGFGLRAEILTTCNIDAVIRKALNQGLHIWNAAQLKINVTIDEVTSLVSPSTDDGVGIWAQDLNWSVLTCSVGICGKEALRLFGNSKWNKIYGAYYDSSTQTDGGFSNILLDTNGSNTPQHNSFDVYAGWTGTGSTNKPVYGINEIAGSNNYIAYVDATGCMAGHVLGSIMGSGLYKGAASIKSSFNFADLRMQHYGTNMFKVDVDSDGTVGGGGFILSRNSGAANLFKVDAAGITIPLVEQTTVPQVPDAGQSEIWHDTAGGSYYLVFSPDGVTTKKIQLL